ncbi:MAG: histidine ammonia-lyase [Bacteriovoracaceae bacterium]|nr:histidine ammonia-lyase [Bacteriovoracaceae bacterium]
MEVIFNPTKKLSIDALEDLLSESSFRLAPSAAARLDRGSKMVRELSQSKQAIYGVNTGFGRLAQVRISESELIQLQINILKSHACGIGEPLSSQVVRRLLLLRAFSLGKGFSGVSSEIIERHLVYLNKNITPMIPIQGSVGASGDLAPLAHLGITFIGFGEFIEDGKSVPAASLLKKLKIKPISIGPKEGLALVNGTQFSLALALEARAQLQILLPWLELSAALSLEAHRGTAAVFDSRLHSVKAHPHQKEVAERFKKILQGSKHMNAHRDCDLVQDSYSYRCIPQVLGPVYSILQKSDELLEDEINSVSDNPILWSSTKELLSGGHFHAHAVSFAADLMSMALATLGNITERRIDQLISPLTARGNAFLADRPGVESGFMILQTAAAAIASENKTLAHPASADSISTNGNQEDHVSMAPWAARKSLMMIENLRRIVAAEIVCGVRGAVHESTRMGLSFSPVIEKFLSTLARKVPTLFLSGDREFGRDWKKIERLIMEPFRAG